MKSLFHAVVGLLFGGVCLWLALRMVDVTDLASAVQAVEAPWIGMAMVQYVLDMSVRIKRWQLLLRPSLPLSYKQVAIALVIGYTVNNLLPARLGELYRADFVKRNFGGSRSSALGSIVVERLLDGTAVIAVLFLGLAILFLNSGTTSVALVAVASTAAAIFAVVAIFVSRFDRLRYLVERVPWSWLRTRIHDFGDALTVLRTPDFRRCIILTSIIYIVETLMIWAALLASGLDATLVSALVVLGAAVLSTLMPTAPGYVGSLQIAYIVALTPFGFAALNAFVAATITQVFLNGGIIAVGLTLLFFTNIRLVSR
jgi:uncharacterized protein (TIRG00374 family)